MSRIKILNHILLITFTLLFIDNVFSNPIEKKEFVKREYTEKSREIIEHLQPVDGNELISEVSEAGSMFVPCYVASLSPEGTTQLSFQANETTAQVVGVNTDSGCTNWLYSVTELDDVNNSWITVIKTGTTLAVSVLSNSGSPRSAIISFVGQYDNIPLMVNQAGACILPPQAGAITGSSSICRGVNGINYSISPIPGATIYTWTLPPGGSFASDSRSNSITVNYSSTATSGNILVYGSNTCGDGPSAGLYVTANGAPATPGTINGTTPVCNYSSATYTIAAVNWATTYTWSVTGGSVTSGHGTTSATIYFTSPGTSTVSVTAGNSCGNSTASTRSVTVTALPTTASIITTPLNFCSLTSDQLGGNSPSIGTGSWSKVSGSSHPVTYSNQYSGSSTVTVTDYGTYVFRWTTANGTCTSSADVVVNFFQSVTPATVGSNQNICGSLTSIALGGNTPALGTGKWTKGTGPGTVTFSDQNSGNSTATVSAYGTYSFIWTISNGSCISSNGVTVNFYQNPTTATVGSTQTICSGLTSTSLGGNTPTIGTGIWSKVSGPAGTLTFSNINSGTSTVTVGAKGNYTFRWTITNGTCTSSADVMVNFPQVPTPGTITGPASICKNNSGNYSILPVAGATLYNWSVTGGSVIVGQGTISATIVFTSEGNSTVSVIATDECAYSAARTSSVIVNGLPTQATIIATPLNICGLTSDQLGGNTPTLGDGSWSKVSGPNHPVIYSNQYSGSSTVTVTDYGSYTFRWTTAYNSCTTAADVVVNFYDAATPATVGTNQDICGSLTSIALGGNTPVLGTGKWTKGTGPGTVTFSDQNSGNSTATVSTFGTYSFIWTISNGSCISSNGVTVNFYQAPTTARVGSTQTICSGLTSTSLGGNTPFVGKGIWSKVSGPAGTLTFSNINSGTSTVTVGAKGIYVFRWTISNGSCSSSADLTVNFPQIPTPGTITGPATICKNTNGTYSITQVAGATLYNWSVTGGSVIGGQGTISATIVFTSEGNSTVSVIATDGCSYSTASNLTVIVKALPTPATIITTPLNVCGLISDQLGGNIPTIGDGYWSKVSGPNHPVDYSDEYNGNSRVTVTDYGSYTFRWTTAYNSCTSSADVVVNFYEAATPSTVGPTQNIYGGMTSLSLGGNTPTIGTGLWTGSGPGTVKFFDSLDGNTTATVTQPCTYLLVWTITNGSCISTNGVYVNFLPSQYPVMGGKYASDGRGLPVWLNGSQLGVNYQLKLNGNNIGSTIVGTGGIINFGYQTLPGEYTIETSSTTANCNSPMLGNASLVQNPLPGVFISEYVEGSNYNKAIEITNMSSQQVDLSLLSLEKDLDGNAIFSNSLPLSGILQPGGSFVVVNNKASSTLLQKANAVVNSMVMEFNGNDQVRLVYNSVVIDEVGNPGGANFGKDVTMIRSRGINDDYLQNKWITFPTDYFLHLGIHTNIQAIHGVIISEYVEGSGQNKAIEIDNRTNKPIDLQNFALQKDLDGDGQFGMAFPVSGILKPKWTLVVANSSGSAALLAKANVTTNTSIMTFNGNDQVRLLCSAKEVDRIGKPGNVIFGEKKTLVRKPTVIDGDPGAAQFDTHWITYPCDDFSHLGMHDILYQAPVPTKTINFIHEITPQKEINNADLRSALTGGTSAQSLTIRDISNKIQYYDGLGKPIQAIGYNSSPKGNDVVQPIAYDAFGREAVNYLSYANGSDGSYKTTAIADQTQFFATTNDVVTDLYPYSQTVFESSPLNRVIEKGSPGAPWQPSNVSIPGSGHTVKYEYTFNSTDEVIMWSVASDNSLAKGSPYLENQLSVIRTTDENGNVMSEFKDKYNRIILKTNKLDATTITQIYYVYDDQGLLRYVLTPELVKNIDNSQTQFDKNSALIKQYGYYYRYDTRNRLVEKQLPGADPVNMVYDQRDRLVLTQDGNMGVNNRWMFTLYDELNRPVMSGTKEIWDRSTDQIRSDFDAYTGTMCETPISTGSIGYTTSSFSSILGAISESDLLIITYYDGYDPITVANGFIPLSNLGAITSEFITDYFDRVKGQVTGTRVKVLDGNEHTATAKWLSSANYYDDHYRLIQNVKQTYPSGVEVTVNQYNFNGSVAETKTYQSLGNVKMDNQITYDHAGRLLSIGQTLTKDGVTKVEPLVAQEYNELGQLTHKKLSGGAQQLDNTYNIRGWLKTINNINSAASNARQFSLSLQYETSSMANATPQFNGNISAMQWRTPGGTGSISSDIQGYTYTYDALNRMNTATYGQGANGSLNPNLYNESIGEYDLNGNILSLTRKKNGILVDDLSYSYDGNRQTAVNDATNNNEIFMERSQSGVEYTYDPNGNMITDRNKGIAIDYNILNLPKHIQGEDDSADYTYDASGNKLAQVAFHLSTTETTYYSGAFVYNGTALDFVLTGEGRAVYANNAFTYEYFLKDHLGNTRVATAANGRVNTSSFYYPFGFTLQEINQQGVNKYLFGGKELQDVNMDGFALNLYDFGARFYDPALGRWTTPDPLAEKARRWNPYNYTYNNPIRFIDPDGMFVPGTGDQGKDYDMPDRNIYTIHDLFLLPSNETEIHIPYKLDDSKSKNGSKSPAVNNPQSEGGRFPLAERTNSYLEFPGRFGDTRSNGNRKHGGCDLYAPIGTPVYAVENGEVIQPAYKFYKNSYALEINHGNFVALYGEINVVTGLRTGSDVTKGQVIGYVANIGQDQNMLHFEMYSGSATGPLTNTSNPPFMRRDDLIDPTHFLNFGF